MVKKCSQQRQKKVVNPNLDYACLQKHEATLFALCLIHVEGCFIGKLSTPNQQQLPKVLIYGYSQTGQEFT
jgi:hypothetical protein